MCNWRMGGNEKQRISTEFKAAMNRMEFDEFNTVLCRIDMTRCNYVSNGWFLIRNSSLWLPGTVANTKGKPCGRLFDFKTFRTLIIKLRISVHTPNHSPFKARELADNLIWWFIPKRWIIHFRGQTTSTRFRELMRIQDNFLRRLKQIKYDETLPENLPQNQYGMLSAWSQANTPYCFANRTLKKCKIQESRVKERQYFGLCLLLLVDKLLLLAKTGKPLSPKKKLWNLKRKPILNSLWKELSSLGEYQKASTSKNHVPLWDHDVITAMTFTLEEWSEKVLKAILTLWCSVWEDFHRSETINVYGASNDPESPHYDDQMSFLAQN